MQTAKRLKYPLPPRLQRTLEVLLTGASEKQIAQHLGLSRHTVHEYVKQIYKHHQVNRRAELMAKMLGEREASSNPIGLSNEKWRQA